MGNYFTQGFILRHINFRDADRLISIYTKDRGLINVLAKGSRKIQSKLAGSLEPFTLAEFMVVKGKKYDTVASSEVINIFKEIKNDLTKIKLSLYFSKILLDTAKEMQKDEKIYEFVVDLYQRINNLTDKKNKEINWMIWFFIWHYLTLSGYQPELYKCLICHKDLIPNKLFINYKKGGLICNDCIKDNQGVEISINLVKIIRTILSSKIDNLNKITISQNLAKELRLHTKNYFSYIFEIAIDIPFFKSN